jgi:high-affinity Fe2+/Pb2+ permease
VGVFPAYGGVLCCLGVGVVYGVMDLFNKSFFRFTMGFIGILIVSFVFAFAVSYFQDGGKTAAVENAHNTEKTQLK